jgi:hypothetical protein
MKRKNFKCKFNPAQAMDERNVIGAEYRMSYGININRRDMMKDIPEKKQEDYDPKFLDWFVNFHAELLLIQDWDRFPEWMMPLLKKRAEEIHEGLRFNR